MASRLTALIYQNALGPLGDLTYQYDAAGNRTQVSGSFARTLLPDAIASSAYDPANRQLALGDKLMTYDANGNLTSISDPSGITTFTWDARNRLVALADPTTTAAFTYDPLGRRLSKTVNGAATQFLYDGLDIAQELDASGASTYLRTLNIDEPLMRNGTEFYLADALGSIVTLTDPAGLLTTTYSYDPFGLSSFAGSPSPNPFQFTARENDVTGLYYYRARYYHPAVYRFASEDPIGLAADAINTYVYVGNNPLFFTDPFGLDKCTAGGADPFPPGLEWLKAYLTIEKPLGRLAVAGGAITSGAAVATVGVIATGALVAATPATYGLSLIGIPGTVLAIATGETLIAFGTDIYVREINALLGTTIPGPGDALAGLYSNRTRYYAPALHRFLSEDPIGLFGGSNFYRYVLNSPISFTDPLGLDVTVTLYPGAPEFLGERGFGHIGVGVNTPHTVGHYPIENSIAALMGMDVPGIVVLDRRQPITTITIRTSPAQDQAMQEVINKALANPPTYNFYLRNCAIFVLEVLRAGGLQFPNTILPRELMQQLQQTYGERRSVPGRGSTR